MKRLALTGVVMALILVAGSVAPVTAAEGTADASVTVNEYISFSVTDNGAAGLDFGSQDANTANVPEAAQPGSSAVTLTVGNETNTDVEIYLMGSDFTDGGGNTITVDNVMYDDDAVLGGGDTGLAETAMDTDYLGSPWTTVTASGSDQSVDVYHWLSDRKSVV